MGYRLTLRSKNLPKPTNVTENWHHFKRGDYRKSWRLWVKYSAIKEGKPPAPLERAKITIDVYGMRGDLENRRHAFKPVIDGLCPEKRHMRKGKPVVSHGAGVIRDDSPEAIGEVEFHFHDAVKGAEHFVLTVEECDAAD